MSHMQLLEVFIATIFDMQALLCQFYTYVLTDPRQTNCSWANYMLVDLQLNTKHNLTNILNSITLLGKRPQLDLHFIRHLRAMKTVEAPNEATVDKIKLFSALTLGVPRLTGIIITHFELKFKNELRQRDRYFNSTEFFNEISLSLRFSYNL
uniref:Uncharacterized protein n=1 Tax=Glossina pallidipes TaxID=7398 RepID=A0A1A9ZJE9_GLOPL